MVWLQFIYYLAYSICNKNILLFEESQHLICFKIDSLISGACILNVHVKKELWIVHGVSEISESVPYQTKQAADTI